MGQRTDNAPLHWRIEHLIELRAYHHNTTVLMCVVWYA